MTLLLKNTVALVTGASSGIGRAVALKLAANGAAVVLVARRADHLKELAMEIEVNKGRALVVPIDITTFGGAEKAIKQAIKAYGRLDTVVNAAGVMTNGPSTDVPVSDWDAMIDINVRGLIYITRASLPHLLEAVKTSPRNVTDVVNVSSVVCRRPAPDNSVYTATKSAINGATEAWRQEFAKKAVRFSLVEPGATQSEVCDNEEDKLEQIDWLRADDLADSVLFIVTSPKRVSINEIVLRPTMVDN